MKALAVCATYGRLPYLGRMLSAFIHQTYEDKHLVIVNDDKNVELCCERKDVTVLNCRTRLHIGHKRNIGIMIGNHDIIFPMDDDDVFLPKKMINHISKYDGSIGACRNREGYIIRGDQFTTNNPGPWNSISFSKKAWFEAGGYTDDWGWEDYEISFRLKNILEYDGERDWIYQQGGVNYSAGENPGQIYSHEETALNQLKSMGLVGKKFWIQPDFEQFNNFCLLDKLYKEKQEPLKVEHISDGKINISHLL